MKSLFIIKKYPPPVLYKKQNIFLQIIKKEISKNIKFCPIWIRKFF